jgi:hypothetical protein
MPLTPETFWLQIGVNGQLTAMEVDFQGMTGNDIKRVFKLQSTSD